MNEYAVFGNPINHSWSPRIHELFSVKTGITHNYGRILVPVNNFEQILHQFFNTGGLGANITLPFKERAFSICNSFTQQGYLTGTINTIKKLMNGALLGDNTDGIGLINDLQRLGVLRKENLILLVGAGGAARGVIPLLLAYGCRIIITNRTFFRAQKLVRSYYYLGKINALPLKNLNTFNYDVIINATSASIQGNVPLLPSSIIRPSVFCYDMFYQKDETPFITWCRRHGALYYTDGLGMLVNQAALAFFTWHGVLPPILPVLKIIRMELNT